jgi:TolA-binding protein
MAFEDSSTMAKNTDVHTEHNNEQQTTQQQLADAHNEIEELKLQIAWLERAYE